MSVSRIIRVVARWAGLAVLFVVTLEVCARIDDRLTWDAPLWGHYSHKRLFTVDELGPHSKFGARFEKWRVNSHGFRGADITMVKPAGVVRVIVIGQSETFGLYERAGMEFPAQLQKKLDIAKPGRYQVLNAGCAGMTLPRFIHYFGVWLKKFDPDIVIYYPTPGSYMEEVVPGSSPVSAMRRPIRPESIRLVRKTRVVVERFLPAFVVEAMHEQRMAIHERRMAAYVRKQKTGWLWEHVPPERLAVFKRHLEEFVRDIRESGAQPMLVTHAHRFPADRAKWSAVDEVMMTGWRWARTSEQSMLEMEDAANRAIRELGKQLGIPVADAALGVPRVPENFADFSHFTDRGAGIMAELLAREILLIAK